MANKVQIVIEVDGRSGTAAIQQVKSGLSGLGPVAQNAGKSASQGIGQIRGELEAIRRIAATAFAAFGVSSLAGAFGEAIAASKQLRSSQQGLQGMSRALGVDMNAAKTASEALAEDGFMNLADSSKGLQNLLASGLNLKFATELMEKNKNAAINSKQAHLGLSESQRVFTQGFKDELSTLTDATGISTNYSRALDDTFKLIKTGQIDFAKYGQNLTATEIATVKQAVATAKAGEQLDKKNKSIVTAIGFLRELVNYEGQAAAAADRLEVQEGKVENQILKNSAAIGDTLAPVYLEFLKLQLKLSEETRHFIDTLKSGTVPADDFTGGLTAGVTAFVSAFTVMKGIGFASTLSSMAGEAALFSGTVAASAAALGPFATAALFAGAAFSGWQIGRLIGEMTGLDGVLQSLFEKMGLFSGRVSESNKGLEVTTLNLALRLKQKFPELGAQAERRPGQPLESWNQQVVSLMKAAEDPQFLAAARSRPPPPVNDPLKIAMADAAAKKFAADRRFFKGEQLEGWARMAKSQAQIEEEGSKIISKSIQDDIESGLKVSNDRILDDFKRRKDAEKEIAQLGFESSLALATTEEERTRLQNERELADFAAKYAGIDGLASASEAYRAKLEEASAAKSAARNRDRVLSLQEEITILQAEVAGGTPGFSFGFGGASKLSRQASRLNAQFGVSRERAIREGASPDVLALMAEKHQLDMMKVQQDAYTDLYNNIADHAGRVWDGMFQKGKNVFQSLADTVKSIWSTAMRKMFSDAVAGLLAPLFAAFSGFGGGAGAPARAGGRFGGLASLGGLVGGGGGLGGIRTPPFLPSNLLSLGGAVAPGVAAGATAATGAGSAFNLSEAIMAAPTTAAPALALSGKTAIGFGGHGITFGQLGAFFTNPFTIAAGIGIAATIAFIKLRKNRQDKFREEILRDFAIAVEDKRLLDQIKRIGESAFGRNADKKRFETLRLDPVQSMLMNYAQQTGQSPALLPLYQRFFSGGLAPASRFDPRQGIPAFAMATGGAGVVTRPTLFLAGESGPERFSFRPTSTPSAAGSPVVFSVSVDARGSGDPAATAQKVEKAVEAGIKKVLASGSIDRLLAQRTGKALKRDLGRRELRDGLFGV